MLSGHVFGDINIDWVAPLGAFAVASIFIFIVQTLLWNQLQKLGFTLSSKDITVDEDLPDFFDCIKLSQADEVVLESRNCKRNYGIEIQDPEIVNLLDK